jgi:thermostable 8-oxoguanine DNA glycosylase
MGKTAIYRLKTKMKAEFVEENLEHYRKTQGVLPEKLEDFGENYRAQGYLTQDQLYQIAYESSTRSAHHVRKNPKERCREVTRNVLEVEGDFSKITLVCGLKGFKAPTASCVLTALEPGKHAVVDTRVWASLERLGYFDERKETFGPDDYVKMIEPIREIAEETGYSPAKVGYALFAYDYVERDGTLH